MGAGGGRRRPSSPWYTPKRGALRGGGGGGSTGAPWWRPEPAPRPAGGPRAPRWGRKTTPGGAAGGGRGEEGGGRAKPNSSPDIPLHRHLTNLFKKFFWLTEMRRVARPGGLIAGYVWDFAGERGPNFPLRRGLQQIGIKPPIAPGTEDSRLEALDRLLDQAGLQEITTRTIDVTESFSDFNDFWRAQTPSFSPATKIIAALPEPDRARLIECVRRAPDPILRVALSIQHARMRSKARARLKSYRAKRSCCVGARGRNILIKEKVSLPKRKK